MKLTTKAMTLVMLAALPFSAFAQEEEEASLGYFYSTYFYCDSGKADRADEIAKVTIVPDMNKAVKDGTIQGWGWLAHHTGGKWRRAQWYSAPTLDALIDAGDTIGAEPTAGQKKLNEEFGQICSSHEDYIWEQVAGGSVTDRGDAGFSVYYICDESREERADEIVKTKFAPIFDKFVEDGKFTSWGWAGHWVGGKFRRLQTMTGPDHKSLLAARGELIEAMYPDGDAEGEEFNEICSSHEDYMWDIAVETP